MDIEQLTISSLRNFTNKKIFFKKGINILHGPNGCGKTAILEAIYLLSSAKSFRASTYSPLIQHGASEAIVHGVFSNGTTVGVKKISSGTLINLNRQRCLSSATLARAVPVQLIYQDVFQLMDAGSGVRRSFLDWGLFYASPEYFSHWKCYRKALKQRNQGLKQRLTHNQLEGWEQSLSDYGNKLDNARRTYMDSLCVAFNDVFTLFSNVELKLEYQRGWGEEGLTHLLKENYQRDLQLGYTSVGPHKADLKFKLAKKAAKKIMSRGQQKMALYALKFAQGRLLNSSCIYLFDDLAAELDKTNIGLLYNYMASLNDQCIVTSLDVINDIPCRAYSFDIAADHVLEG